MGRARWRRVIAVAGLAAVLSTVGAGPVAALEPIPSSSSAAAPDASAPGPGEGLAPPGGAAGPAAVFVELTVPSAIDEYTALLAQGPDIARRAAVAGRARIADITERLLARLRGTEGERELFRTTNAVAGVALRVDAATARELAARPDVRSVRRITLVRPSNGGAVQLGRAVQAWQQTGKLGEGVRIGVVDSGIDYTHALFGGPGTEQAYAAIDPTTADPEYFPTEKVVGGIDLAGDDYDGAGTDPAALVPRPDPNPLDCAGHGTHVAGTAAGYGVAADGSTFRGDHATLTPQQLGEMRIGPGAAPRASLYAIRVFGCQGPTALTALGLDHALDPDGDGDFSDRLDVVNLSLGAEFGASDDPLNDFVAKLTEHGVLVVAAAGNTGDLYDAAGPPGNSPHALAVAAVRDAAVLQDGLGVLAPAALAGTVPGQYSVGYERYPGLDLSGRVVALSAGNADGCAPYSAADAAAVRGAVVWLHWADEVAARACGSAPRAANADTAGAAAVLLTSGRADFGAMEIAGNAAIPMFQLTGPATEALRPALADGTLRVRLAGELVRTVPGDLPQIEDTPNETTSRGTRGPAVKPDVAAPGQSITSAAVGTGAGRATFSGTSMASSFVAGIAALVRETHPDWTPEQVKAAVMNTANGDVYAGEGRSGPLMAPMRVGAGRVDARAAVGTSLLAMAADRPGAVSVAFGTVEAPPGTAVLRTERIRVVNTGGAPAVLGARYEPITEIPGVHIEVSPTTVAVPPVGSVVVDVRLRIDDPRALRRTADPTVALAQEGLARQYPADASGRVVFTPVDLPPGAGEGALRVPVSAAPKPVSTLTVPAQPARGGLVLGGTGVDQGTGPQAYRSRVGVFELVADSPELPLCAGTVVTGCVANRTGRGGDLHYVGVMSTAPAARAAGTPDQAVLGFAVTTWADLYNVGSTTQPTVEIDVDVDDRPDFSTTLTKVEGTDVLVATTVDLRRPQPDGGLAEVDSQPVNGFFGDTDTNVFDTDAWVLPVRLRALGIDPSAASALLRFRVVVHGEYGPPESEDGLVDRMATPVAFDPLDPGLTVGPAAGVGADSLTRTADAGTTLTVGGTTRPLLVVFGQNASGSRVAVVGPPPGISAAGR
ncbi:S8 family peptidase [Pseudonocardia bannensis]|uniref:S8 family serine peptidase n=1 Tax=Pseudonocardia bannensis TaxID=630973 RepID=A0A848DJJ0_9PSEU|nr:S8 family serine peptidase [Pseudonocardia bannensis]NMH92858.1 S8 family serine peptidase [Pseudonocardia bannensis]